jgi:hypothetical protein
MHMAFIATIILSSTALSQAQDRVRVESEFPVRAITAGPNAHWFGYYDKLQFDPSGRYVLGMQTTFEGRKATADDAVTIGMVDLEDDDHWIPLGTTRAWSWQQGCMLQWLPGSKSEIIYNDRQDDAFVSIIQDVFTGEKRTLPRAVYAVSPNGKQAVSVNFARIDQTRPGYGYAGGTDPGFDELAPDNDGIYTLDLETGDAKLLFTYAQIRDIPWDSKPLGKHWFNHLLYSPSGERFIFLHRAKVDADGKGRWHTRMFTAGADGSGLHVLADHDMVSHFIWRDAEHILAWAREPDIGDRFVLYKDQDQVFDIIGDGVLARDGHCTYSPDGQWICTDTYPGKDMMHKLMLYRPSDGKLVHIGKFYRPKPTDDEFRCDLHPGWSRDGRYLCIDSMHGGDQRQMYLIDVSSVTLAD